MQSLQDIDWSCWQGQDIATLTFIVQHGHILLMRKKRGLGAGKINGPGGRLEPGETPLECAIREVQEELCIKPVNPQFCGESLFQFADGYSIHVHTFLASEFTGTPQETDEAIPLWFALDQIPYSEMWADDILWIPEMLKGNHFRGRYLFDDDRMVDHHLDIL